jgi:hypothetical protein
MEILNKEYEEDFDNLELFADIISNDSYYFAGILKGYHLKLKELGVIQTKMTLKEFDVIVFTKDIQLEGKSLKAGTCGTIVHIFSGYAEQVFNVEIVGDLGSTIVTIDTSCGDDYFKLKN